MIRPHEVDIDLRHGSADDFDRLARHTTDQALAVVADQHLDPGELEACMGRLGELMFTPGERPIDGHRYVFEVTNRNRSDVPRSVLHTDTSYVIEPPSYTALSAVEVPESGGATVVHHQTHAAATLPDDLRNDLRGVELLHVASRVADPDAAGSGAWHPVLRRHGRTGVTTLFLSALERLPAARRHGVLLDDAEAATLIAAAHAHGASVRGVEHHWRPGDVLFVDNATALHRAEHHDVVGIRTLHRVMVRGEAPLPAS